MSKLIASLSCVALVALAVVLWLGAPASSTADAAVTVAASPDPEPVPAISAPASNPSAVCGDQDPLSAAGGEQVACCIDECSRDRDCRTICGKDFGGQCVQVNSCCRQCFCLGFAPTTGLPS